MGHGGGTIKRQSILTLLLVLCIASYIFPYVGGTESQNVSYENTKIGLSENKNVLGTNAAYTVKIKVKVKVKVWYKYEGQWKVKYVYKYVYKTISLWKYLKPSRNAQSNDARIIAKMRILTAPKIVTVPNPQPRPSLPTPVDLPGDKPQLSNYSNVTAYNTAHTNWLNSEPQLSDYPDNTAYNVTAYNTVHTNWLNSEPQLSDYSNVTTYDVTAYNTALADWESRNAAYQSYLAAKKKYDQYQPTITKMIPLTTFEKATNIFNWVRDNLGYSFYYNTRYGAVGALQKMTGNCVDTAHVVVALARAAKIPARYAHGNVRFPSGHIYGHVWAQLFVKGRWYTADGTSLKNSLGYMRGIVLKYKGTYRSLPF